jgi:ethanolamine utilization protein EutN
MRLGWVMGRVVLNRNVPDLKPGSWLIVEAVDADGLSDMSQPRPRTKPMPESLVVYDHLGAGPGDLIAFSEGAEATQPFRPEKVPIDAYCTAILDRVTITN